MFQQLGLMTAKPVLYDCNCYEGDADKGNAHSQAVSAAPRPRAPWRWWSRPRSRARIAVMPVADQTEFLEAVGLTEPASTG